MAKKAKYTFVVGGVNSSNTKELFNLCKEVSNSYLFLILMSLFLLLKSYLVI